MDSNDPEIMHQKGNCYAALGKYKEALEYINNSISKIPSNAYYRYSLVAVHVLMKDFKAAEFALKECQKIDPNNPETALKLSEFYMRIGEKEKSMEAVLKAEELSPGNPA